MPFLTNEHIEGDKPGVITQHQDRAANDKTYRERHLTPPGLKRGPANTETEEQARELALSPAQRDDNAS